MRTPKYFLTTVSILILGASAQATGASAPGNEKYNMTQAGAIQYCARQGNHLPSARELAQLAMSLGAKGIMDACGSSEPKCYLINATNADGSDDSFSFSYAGYQQPAEHLGDRTPFWFWSSSVDSSNPYTAFGLDDYDGNVYSNARYILGAVRCVSGH